MSPRPVHRLHPERSTTSEESTMTTNQKTGITGVRTVSVPVTDASYK